MELSPLIRSLLQKRGIEKENDIAAFLNPDYELHTHNPLLLQDMEVAVSRVLSGIEKDERIAVYADFDSDGIPGAAVMSDFFDRIAYTNFEIYLPHRDREGHGFHLDAIEGLIARGATLIITVDVGTTAVEAVQCAKEKGAEVIITDHHELTGALPEAVAVVNPKRAPYPFPDLCGAALAFKLVQASIAEGKRRGMRAFELIPDGWEKWLLDLVAIATVADMVPLIGENRVLAYWGLQVLRKSQRPGIDALCNALRLRKAELTEEEIGFSIAPRINAASRMDEPQSALKLLTTRDRREAELIAAHLEALNASRKGVVAGLVREAKRRAKARFPNGEKVVVLGDTEWKPSLLGLAANSLVDNRGGLVCLWGRDALGRIKGSCRSDGSLSVVEVFTRAADQFVEFGGHERSGGFTLISEKVHSFQKTLAAAAEGVEKNVVEEKNEDAQLALREVAPALLRELAQLAPFGIGNPKPLFKINRATIKALRRFGKEKNHVEVALVCPDSGMEHRSFDFFRSPEDFTHPLREGAAAAILATIERDSYRGGLALRLVDVHLV